MTVVDLALARTLERAEGMACAACVNSRQQQQPHVNAEWIDVAGAYAMFDGPESPLTQTFGLGVFEPFGVREFERVERFYSERGAATQHEVCSFASPDVLAQLSARGYSPIEASVVLVRSTDGAPSPESGVRVRAIDATEAPTWVSVSARAWAAESAELGAFLEQLGTVMSAAKGVKCFLAEMDGKPIAAAALNVQNGIALLAGAATVLEARRNGAQAALFQARLRYAAERGVKLAMVVTQPGSQSQRNAEKRGFRAVYTRAKWQRPIATD